MRRKPKLSREQRGYGAAHKILRANAARVVQSGRATCCRRDRRPIAPTEAFHLDHDDDDRSRYRGVSHAVCNLRAAAAKTNAKCRRRVSGTSVRRTSRDW